MAHHSKPMWWQCLEDKWKNKTLGFRWLLHLGHPEDVGSECFFEFPDEEFRAVVKGLPEPKDGLIITARMTCVPCRAPKRGKLRPWVKKVKFNEAANPDDD